MPTVDLTKQQALDLLKQLPSESKRSLLYEFAEDSEIRAKDMRETNLAKASRIASSKGLDWNSMTDEERETLMTSLVHEVRQRKSS